MRAITFCTPNVSRATRAEMILELSPLLTAANASASSIFAATSVSRSKPRPVTVVPRKPSPRRRNASGLMSMTATLWPRLSSWCASDEPTRPHPMITTCTAGTSPFCAMWPRGPAAATLHNRPTCRRPPSRHGAVSCTRERYDAGRQAAGHRQPGALGPHGACAASETAGAAYLCQRRTVERGLRHAGDLARADRRWDRVSVPHAVDCPCGGRTDGDSRRLVPPTGTRLPDRWRRLRGRHQEHRPPGRCDRGERAAGGLCDDGGGVGVVRRGQHHLRGAVAGPAP